MPVLSLAVQLFLSLGNRYPFQRRNEKEKKRKKLANTTTQRSIITCSCLVLSLHLPLPLLHQIDTRKMSRSWDHIAYSFDEVYNHDGSKKKRKKVKSEVGVNLVFNFKILACGNYFGCPYLVNCVLCFFKVIFIVWSLE